MSGTSDSDFKYWAFVSYSSKDRAWGEWLIRKLETYRVPSSLVGLKTGCGTIPARLYPVFRDRDELPAGADRAGAAAGAWGRRAWKNPPPVRRATARRVSSSRSTASNRSGSPGLEPAKGTLPVVPIPTAWIRIPASRAVSAAVPGAAAA